MLELGIAADVAGRVRLGLLTIEGVAVRERDARLDAELDRVCTTFRERYGAGKSSQVPGTDDARTLYKALGLDPTKTRPSNEALLRRALKGEGLYRINTLVDALNLVSLREQLPFGLYDLDRLTPPLEFRKGRPGEAYEGIRKGLLSAEGRPLLADAQGPFGNPSADSLRTSISLATRNALVIAYAPRSYGEGRLGPLLERTAEALVLACGGRVVERRELGTPGLH